MSLLISLICFRENGVPEKRALTPCLVKEATVVCILTAYNFRPMVLKQFFDIQYSTGFNKK
uniref:Uncharacterized protein n=1 Tax=Anguilla anguilla TaxID=7936 RepID=A0A0E9PPB1_ANGAN